MHRREAESNLRLTLCQLDQLRLRREQLNAAIAALEALERQSLEWILRPKRRFHLERVPAIGANGAEASQTAA